MSKKEYQLFAELVEKECGVKLNEELAPLLETRIMNLMAHLHCHDYDVLYQMLRGDTEPELKTRIIEAVINHETTWFRDEGLFDLLSEKLFPRLIEEIATGRRSFIRVWSAACASGQEPYSVAITFMDCVKKSGHPVRSGALSILATDISQTALEEASGGEYSTQQMSRGMRSYYRKGFFKSSSSGKYQIVDEVRRLVEFLKLNLLKNDIAALGKFDIVLCRNVGIYFTSDAREQLYQRLATSLNRDGALILGASEFMADKPGTYRLESYKGTYYYTLT
ncbi:MAG: protein-glutamate O-methyltransferase CheR [Nitrospinae bacterium]|nr:protein-glutamate O-methyltransferase CheR [Nitrospinota bacterium]